MARHACHKKFLKADGACGAAAIQFATLNFVGSVALASETDFKVVP